VSFHLCTRARAREKAYGSHPRHGAARARRGKGILRVGLARAHLDEVVADALGGGVEGLLGPERERREVGAVLRVVGDVAGDLGGLIRRGAGRRLHFLGRGAIAPRHGGHPAGGRWGVASSSWRARRMR